MLALNHPGCLVRVLPPGQMAAPRGRGQPLAPSAEVGEWVSENRK